MIINEPAYVVIADDEGELGPRVALPVGVGRATVDLLQRPRSGPRLEFRREADDVVLATQTAPLGLYVGDSVQLILRPEGEHVGAETTRQVAQAKRPTVIRAGTLLTISTGEYSAYRVEGVFRAVKDIDAAALRETYLTAHPDQRKPYHFRDVGFLAWVSRLGLLEPVDCSDWHISEEEDVSLTHYKNDLTDPWNDED